MRWLDHKLQNLQIKVNVTMHQDYGGVIHGHTLASHLEKGSIVYRLCNVMLHGHGHG